jgi:uroporphyrinogen-III synthase
MSSQPIHLLATGAVHDRLVDEAARSGLVLDIVPFIDIEYMDVKMPIPEVAVFTSANAVKAVKRGLQQTLPDWRIYCVSGATYDAVVELFGEKTVAGKAGSASELGEVICSKEKGDRGKIIFFCGDHRREELPSIGVTEKVVYRTVLTPRPVGRNYDGIAFFSPSAVESFFSINGIMAGVPLFAIGGTTELAIAAGCTNPVFRASKPDKAVLIREMIEYFLFKP